MSFEALLEASHTYGSDARYVLLGGGNTSFKDGNLLYVKASGFALSTISEKGFVRMNLKQMEKIWEKTYSEDDDAREDEVLKDMMECRLEGETARPSVEALLHALLPFSYVVHLHPALINGVTCSQHGASVVQRLFPDALWIELVKPGFILAKIVRERLSVQKQKTGNVSKVIFLQNHGVFVGGESLGEIESLYAGIMKVLEAELVRKPDFTALPMDEEKTSSVVAQLERLTGEKIIPSHTKEYAHFLADTQKFASIASSFTPDHIVYSGFMPLWVGENDSLEKAFSAFEHSYGTKPKIVCVQNLGVFSIGEKPAPLFRDTVAVSVYSESFGGPRFMDDAMIDFIRNWEVEKYRSSVMVK